MARSLIHGEMIIFTRNLAHILFTMYEFQIKTLITFEPKGIIKFFFRFWKRKGAAV